MCIDDITFFSSLGFNAVESLDFVSNENPTYVHDLNLPVPKNLENAFDVIFDGGTAEHVFDVAQLFRNIHKMLKPGGVIIHDSPTNNFVDHGFWQLCPTVFADTYQTNGYDLLDLIVYTFSGAHELHSGTPTRCKYDPTELAKLSIGGFPNGMGATFSVARKPLDPEEFKTPVQGFYQKHWKI